MIKKLFPHVKTSLGFPVGKPDGGKDPKQSGMAIIVALFMTAMMLIMMADMQLNSVVDSELAAAHRDNLKAEYLAKSGANLANLLITADLAYDLFMAETQGANAKATDSNSDMWALFNYIPIGPDQLDQMKDQFDLSAVADGDVISELKLFEGDFSMVVKDESTRINVNNCGLTLTSQSKCKAALKALLSCPAEREYLERKKLNPNEVVANITDWVDNNTTAEEESGQGSESDPYNNRVPKTNVKNSFFDSLDEMKLVAGWDSDMHKIFSPYLTVYPLPIEELTKKSGGSFLLNFNTAPRELLNCLFPKAATECSDKSALYQIAQDEAPTVADSPAAIQQTLKDSFCADEENTKIFTYRSDVFRVVVSGIVGTQERKLEYVFQRQLPDAQDVKNQYNASYKYLYWKML